MTAQRLLRERYDDVVDESAPRITTPATVDTSRKKVAAPGAAAAKGAANRSRLLTPASIYFMAVLAAIAFGINLPTSAYLSPQSGLGYALGIAGGSAMLLLLLYPVRKRMPNARYLGSTRAWFRLHMTLGIFGPALILFHSNFSLGATNSNVALVCMLIVSGSGLFGRYFYGHIHQELNGREATLDELREFSSRLQLTSSVSFLPALARHIDAEQTVIERRFAATALLLQPLLGAAWAIGARRRLRRAVREAIAAGADRRHDPSREPLRLTAYRYIDDRIGATRRVLEFRAFQKFFSLWHALHLPLFVMLIIAGTVHVVAVHIY
ncbi:MAG: hypothetical protein KBF50_01215 [Steroidobacteraceae bacterium]|jgi:hypothetical protein|nr:hypothetical protein [Steroidobacteraceae bacterium]